MMMNTKKRTVKIWAGGLIGILGIGMYLGGVTFEMKGTSRINYTTQEISGILTNIRPISGFLFISPGSLPKFQGFLGLAQHTLLLQTYEFTEKNIKKLFSSLLNNGVNIKLIMENKKYQQYKNTFKEIQTLFSGYENFQIKSDDQMKTTYVHSKIAIIDSGFLIQTANLTHSSFASNREYFFWSTDTGILASLHTIFRKDWEGKPLKKSDIHPNLVVCNINCRSVIEHLITSAQSSIKIQNQYIDDPKLQTLLLNKIKELGASQVQIQLPTTDKNKSTQQLLGNQSVHLFKKPYLHAKMLLVDNTVLLLGSMNFSANSLDNNREIGILLSDKNSIDRFVQQFSADARK